MSSQLPPDPLSHISNDTVPDEFVAAMARFCVDNILWLQFTNSEGVEASGYDLLRHIVRSICKKAKIQGSSDYLCSLTDDDTPRDGMRPFSDIYWFIGRLTTIIGREKIAPMFNEVLKDRKEKLGRGSFAISPSMESSASSPAPQQPQGEEHDDDDLFDSENTRQHAQRFARFASSFKSSEGRGNKKAMPNCSLSREGSPRSGLSATRDIFTTHDEDLVNIICASEEEKILLRSLPQYCFMKSKESFFKPAIRAILRHGMARREDPVGFLKRLQERSLLNMREKGGSFVPSAYDISSAMASYHHESPAYFVSSLEFAALLLGDLKCRGDMEALALARCFFFTDSSEYKKAKEGLEVGNWGTKVAQSRDF